MTDHDFDYDILVIGGGPGGYVAAIRAAQLGHKVACVEKRDALGGTCLNIGCIPSKALLDASEKYEELTRHGDQIGIEAKKVKLNLSAMMAHKDAVVDDNTKGIDFLFDKNGVDRLTGHARFTDPHTVEINADKTVSAKHIIIATGSKVASLPGIDIDENRIVSSTGALSLDSVPDKMIVIGGGYIGIEMGTVWRRLGAEVTVLEYADDILPAMDKDVRKSMHKILTKQGMDIKTGVKVTGAAANKKSARVTFEAASNGSGGDKAGEESLTADIVLVAVGRHPNTDNLGAEVAGIALDERGRIITDDQFNTNVDHIYAIGDVTDGPMLAHKAEDEGVAIAEIIDGQAGHVNYTAIPYVVYTAPEVAQVGRTEDELIDSGIEYKVGKFNFSANGRARAMNATDGFVKILADADTDAVLGCHIVGAQAGHLIGEIALGIEFYAAAEDIARTSHAHPTLSEAIKEAALAVDGRALHS
jgi:dihydrolipoamide dehydrogenase